MDLINKKSKKSFDGAKSNFSASNFSSQPRKQVDFSKNISGYSLNNRPVSDSFKQSKKVAPKNNIGINLGDIKNKKRLSEQKRYLSQEKIINKNENNNLNVDGKKIAILDKLLMVSISMLFIGLPLFFLNLTYQGINFEKQYYFYLWTFAGLVIWGIRSIIAGSLTLRRTPLDFVLLAFLIIYGLSALFSVDRYHSFFGFFSNSVHGFVSVLIMILAYYLIILNVNYSRAKILLFSTVVIGSTISVWFTLCMLKIIPSNVLEIIPLNLIGDSFASLTVYFGVLVIMLLTTLAIVDESNEISEFKPVTNVFIFLILVVTIFNISILFEYVRWIPILISISIFLVFILARVIHVSQKIIYISVGTFLVLIALFIFGESIFKSEILSVEIPPINYNDSWKIAEQTIKNKPILGSGPSTFGYNFSLFLNKPMDVRIYSGRGIIFESLTTTGILGFTGLIAVILTYIGSFVHMLNKYGNKSKMMSLGLFVSVIILIFSGSVWNLDGGLILLGSLLGALSIRVVQGESNSDGTSKTFSLKTSPQHALMHSFLFLVVVISIIFGAVTFSKMFMDDLYAGNAVRAESRNEFAEGLKYLMKTNDLRHKEGRYYTIGAQYSLLLANKSIAEDDTQVYDHVNNAVGQAIRGAEMMPNDVFANEVAGFVYESGWKYIPDGALDNARKFYKKASELEPENPSFYISLGRIDLIELQTISAIDEVSVNRKKELAKNAQSFFRTAESKFILSDRSASVYYYLATADEFLGDIDSAIKNMEKSIEASKKDLSIKDQLGRDKAMNQQINYGFNLARLLQIRGADENNVNAKVDNERAENLFKQILGVDGAEISVLISLGHLYEMTDRFDEAIEQYKKVLETLPKDSQARESVQKLIDEISLKKSNFSSTNENE